MKQENTQNNVIEMSRYIDLEKYNEIERTHPFYNEMIDKIIAQVKKHRRKKGITRILEIGAGTGILTNELSKIDTVQIDALDIDSRCCELLRKYVTADNVNIIQDDAVTYCRPQYYDFVVSSFAHDHISYDRKFDFSKNISQNLKKNGVYIMGNELLPPFSNEEERKRSLYLYHNFIIDKAKSEGHVEVAELEKQALISGLEQIGDFKRHEKMLEEELSHGGMQVSFKEKIGPKRNDKVGGVYVYTFIKK